MADAGTHDELRREARDELNRRGSLKVRERSEYPRSLSASVAIGSQLKWLVAHEASPSGSESDITEGTDADVEDGGKQTSATNSWLPVLLWLPVIAVAFAKRHRMRQEAAQRAEAEAVAKMAAVTSSIGLLVVLAVLLGGVYLYCRRQARPKWRRSSSTNGRLKRANTMY